MPSHRTLVIGGTGALGSAVCSVLAREGCTIAFTYHTNESAARNLESTIAQMTALQCDLKDVAGTKRVVEAASEKLDGLDSLIITGGTSGDDRFWKCAAPGNYDKLQEIDPPAFDEMIAVNSRGPLAACQAAAPRLRAGGGGNILIIRSIDGIKPVPSPIHFAASTAAVKGIVEAMSKELGNYNIRVNILALGILDGGASRKLSREVKEAYLKHCSLRRFGTTTEIAEFVAWMAMENTYVTGQAIVLDGGL